MFGDLFLSSCPGMGKDLLGDIQIIKDLNIKCLISLVEENELTNLGAKDLFKELDKNKIKWVHFEIINFSARSWTWDLWTSSESDDFQLFFSYNRFFGQILDLGSRDELRK